MHMVNPPPQSLLNTADRRAAGRAIRQRLPRGAHAIWQALAGRPDPVALLQAAGQGRIASLLPGRYGRMAADIFGFLRGAAPVMAADLGGMAHSGLIVQACGDCHLMNFGAYASPEGAAVFDINDFDETQPAPFEWDLKRLVSSVAVASLVRGGTAKSARALARRTAHAYRQHMHDLAHIAPLDAWRSRIDLAAAVEDIGAADVRKRERQRLTEAVEASRDAYRHLVWHGKLRLREDRPGMFRLPPHEQVAHAAFANYRDSLPEERRILLERYRLHDVAFKAVGVGSRGTFCAIGLLVSGDGDPLLLQLKQAQASVLAPYCADSRYANHGERVVTGQRVLQAASDIFLGWAQGNTPDMHFYVRLLRDQRLAAVGSAIARDALRFYAKLCGRTLARAHARSGDAAAISGYLGESVAMDDALAEFAIAYAGQTRADHAALVDAINQGHIAAEAVQPAP